MFGTNQIPERILISIEQHKHIHTESKIVSTVDIDMHGFSRVVVVVPRFQLRIENLKKRS